MNNMRLKCLQSNISLSSSTKKKINSILTKFPYDKKRSAVLSVLHFVQDENNGFLSSNLIEDIATYLKIPPIFVYEVASFYSMYNLSFNVKVKICICTNITCTLCGARHLLKEIKSRYKLDDNLVSKNKKFFLSEVECLALCDKAPVLQIGKVYYFHVTKDIIFNLLDKLEN